MALTSIFWTTNGTGDGGAAYTTAQLAEWLRSSLIGDPATEGVVPGVGGELAVTGTASPLTVAAGFAYVYGFPAWDNSSRNITLDTPLIGTTGHRIVLRADWAAQTVRVEVLSSSDGVAAIPAITQTAGTVWEISLATVTITTGGVVAVTDTRQYVHYNTRVSTAMLDSGAVTTAKIADAALTTAKIADAQVTAAKLASGAAASNLGNASVTAAKLAAGVAVSNLGFTPWGPSNDGDGSGLDADKVAGVDIAPVRRQGGNGTNWGAPGGSNLSPTAVRTQLGAAEATPGTSSGSIAITFPTAFAGTPVVTANSSMNSVGGAALDCMVAISALTTTGCVLNWQSVSGATISRIAIAWVAIGPS